MVVRNFSAAGATRRCKGCNTQWAELEHTSKAFLAHRKEVLDAEVVIVPKFSARLERLAYVKSRGMLLFAVSGVAIGAWSRRRSENTAVQ